VVPYGTLTGERHWTWYRKTHCQVRGTGRGSVLIEIFINYFFGAEEKVSQFVMHQFATFISLIFTTLLCISIELLNYLIYFNQENVGSISKSNSSPT
jgi:hypothetical protein